MRANRRTSGLFLIGLTLLFLSGAPLDSHAQIITSVDPDSVNLGETVVVTITGEGTFFHEWSSVTDSLFFGLGCWTLLAEDVLVHSPTLIDATFDLSQANPGYVNEWQGELQLSAGKFGTFEVIGKVESTNVSASNTTTQKRKEGIPAVDSSVEEEIIE